MKRQLTPWFPPNIKPVRLGVYISTVVQGVTFYRRWDGENWHYGDEFSPDRAAMVNRLWTLTPLHWRGLLGPLKDPS